MKTEDVSDIMTIATSTPQEAADNIAIASHYDTTPEAGKELSHILKPDMENERLTPIVPRAVAERMKQSTEHASIIKKDLNALERIGKGFSYAMDSIKGSIDSRRVFNLNYKKINQGLSEEEAYELDSTNEKIQSNDLRKEYGYDFKDAIPGEIASTIFDMGAGAWQNKQLVGSGTVAGLAAATLPALLSSAAPPVSVGVAAAGAFTGTMAGLAVSQVKDTYEQSVGQVYNDLTYVIKDDNGDNVIKTEDERIQIAKGAGVVMAALDSLSTAFLAGKFTKSMLRREVLKKALSPTGGPILRLMKNLAGSAASEGVTEALQQFVQQTAKEIGGTWDGDDTKNWEGMTRAAEALMPTTGTDGQIIVPDALKELGEAGTLGAIVGSGFTAAGVGGGKLLDKGLNNIAEKRRKKLPLIAEEQELLDSVFSPMSDAQAGKITVNQEVAPQPVAPKTDLTGKQVQIMDRVTKVAHLELALNDILKNVKNLETQKYLPEEIDMMVQEMANEEGLRDVWVDPETLAKFSNSDKKNTAVNNILDPTRIAEGQAGSSIRFTIAELMRLGKEFPEITSIISMEPEDPSVKGHVERLEKVEEKRNKLKAEMPRIEGIDIGPGMKTEQIDAPALLATLMQDEDTTRIPLLALDESQEILELTNKAIVQEAKDRRAGTQTVQNDLRELKLNTVRMALENRIRKVESLMDERVRDEDIQGFPQFLEQPTFTEEMYDVVPESEAIEHNEAVIKSRIQVSNALIEDAQLDQNEVTEIDKMRLIVNAESAALTEAESDVNISIVEDFINNKRQFGDLTEFQEEQMRKGNPIYAINPDSIMDGVRDNWREVWDKYKDHPVLKERGVFNKKGASIDSVLSIFEIETADEFFKILAESPTVEQYVERHAASRAADIEAEAKGNTQFDLSKTVIAYDESTKLHLKTGKIMREKFWSVKKKQIMRTAAPAPNIDALAIKAKFKVNDTKIKHLHANQWKVAERRSHRNALKAALDEKLEVWGREHENVALSMQMAKQTHVEIGKFNHAVKRIAKMNLPENQKILKKTKFLEAWNNIMDVYNFDPSKKGQSQTDAYNTMAKQMLSDGQGDYRIAPEVQELMSTKVSVNEMTVDEFTFMYEKLQNIMHEAKMKNKMMNKYERDVKELSMRMISDMLVEKLQAHPGHNIDYANRPVIALSPGQTIVDTLMTGEASMSNIKSITDQLDEGNLGGVFREMFWDPIEGTGKFIGQYGLRARAALQGEIRRRHKVAIDKYNAAHKKYNVKTKLGKVVDFIDEGEYKRTGITKAVIPEFRRIRELNNGNLVKRDLLIIAGNIGSESGWQRVENYGKAEGKQISREKWVEILTRELTVEDFQFIQEGVWDIHQELKPRVEKVHKILTGEDLRMVESQSFTVHGKEFAGGYMPLKLNDNTKTDTSQFTDQDLNFNKHPAFEGMVYTPMMKVRTGTNLPIDLNTNTFTRGFDEVSHAVTMSVPVKDTMKLLNDPEIAKHLKAVLGIPKYKAMQGLYAGLTNSISAQNSVQYAEMQKVLANMINRVGGVYILNSIMGNINSFKVNFLTVPKIINKMGVVQGNKHMTIAGLRIGKAFMTGQGLEPILEFFGELDGTIFARNQGLNDFNASTFEDLLPKKRLDFKLGPKVNFGYHTLKNLQEGMIKALMDGVLGNQDLMFKMTVSLAGYNQFMSGDVPGVSMSDVQAMSAEERHQGAKAYANSLSASTTMRGKPSDKAAVQNILATKDVSFVLNEVRQTFNNNISDGRQLFFDSKKVITMSKRGDTWGAAHSFWDAGSRATRMLFIGIFATEILTGLARGKNPFEDEDEDFEDFGPEQVTNWLLNKFSPIEDFEPTDSETTNQVLATIGGVAGGTLRLPVDLVINNAAFLRSIVYSEMTGQGITTPLMTGITALVKGPQVAAQMMGDGLNVIEAFDELNKKERILLLHSIGILIKGIPVKLTSQIYDYYQEMGVDDDEKAFQIASLDPVKKVMDRFVEKFNESEEEAYARTETTEMQAVVDYVKEEREKMTPTPITKPNLEPEEIEE